MPNDTPVTYGDINFKNLDITQYRYIEFNGYNSLTDLGLVINGLAPLSPVTPKILTKELPLSDGVIDISRVDGSLHYGTREITYDFLFINEKSLHYNQTIATEEYINNAINNCYQWLLGNANIDLYDSTYGDFKFTNASVISIDPKRTIVGDEFVTVLTVTFRMDPWLVSRTGTRVEFAQFVDRQRVGTGQQSVCYFYNNNKFWVNDNENILFANRLGPHHYRLSVKLTNYQGLIGIYYVTTILYTDEQGVEHAVHTTAMTTSSNVTLMENTGLQYYYANTGAGSIVFDITTDPNDWDDFVDLSEEGRHFQVNLVWGVITEYSLPDQNHYHFDVFSKSNNVVMWLNQQRMADYTTFSLPTASERVNAVNAIEIDNPTYDGFYKLYYDSTRRRLM